MNTINQFFKFTLLVLILGLVSCKKEEAAPSTGSIKVVFSGTPSAQFGQKVTLKFAQDFLHLQAQNYSFTKVSNAPHAEFIIPDLEPRDWYYDQELSTPGTPDTSEGNVKVEAGKTVTLTVVF